MVLTAKQWKGDFMKKMIIPVGDFVITNEEKEIINEILEYGRISEGPKTLAFQKAFAGYVGTKHCVALNSGTSALIAGLLALQYSDKFPKVRKGAKVITSPISYIATSTAIVHAGMEPVWVDIDPERLTINCEEVEALLEKDPNGYALILPVHLLGFPNNIDRLIEIGKKYGVEVVEDSAQAHGSYFADKTRTGSKGILGTFSFYIAHNIQAGELGAITTSNSELKSLITQIKANGRYCDCPKCTRHQNICPYITNITKKKPDKHQYDDPRFLHLSLGYNFKTMEFAPALALSQIKKADSTMRKRQDNVMYLNKRLEKYSSIFKLPVYDKDVSYLAYPIEILDNSINRTDLQIGLENKGVETRPLFGCIPTQQPVFANKHDEYLGKLPNAERLGKRAFYIGCHQYLTDENLNYIVKSFDEIIEDYRVIKD